MTQSNFERPAETVTELHQNISELGTAHSLGHGTDQRYQAKESMQVVAQNFETGPEAAAGPAKLPNGHAPADTYH